MSNSQRDLYALTDYYPYNNVNNIEDKLISDFQIK